MVVVSVAVLATATGWACEEEGKSDSERLADEVAAERCVVPPGGTGAIYTCEFGDGERKRCYEVGFVPGGAGGELEFRIMLRHEGACTPEDKPSLPDS